MSNFFYSIRIYQQDTSTILFDGYFQINENNSVIAFYDNTNPTTNILGPDTFPFPLNFYNADDVFDPNTYLFVTPEVSGNSGTNFTSSELQNTLNLTYPYFNIFVDASENVLWQESNIANTFIVIEPYVLPISNICFPEKTPILTDHGPINIEFIDTNIHTINKKKICAITKTILNDTTLVCFRKNSIAENYPTHKTTMTKEHKIYYKGRMFCAFEFLNKQFDGVYLVKYNGEILYNVLLETHNKMIVNGLLCETLNPTNIIAKLYKNYSYISHENRERILAYINKKNTSNIQTTTKKKSILHSL